MIKQFTYYKILPEDHGNKIGYIGAIETQRNNTLTIIYSP